MVGFTTSKVLRHVVLGSVAATATWVALRMQTNFGPTDILLPPATTNASVDQHFAETYYQARALFRKHASAAGGQLHTLPLPKYEHLDLTTDIVVFKGASDKVIVHLSGTHGVEGFAGSAIQSGILQNWGKVVPGPTVVFVHAVNPYGFSMLRRFNEHNVDLNRNWLTDAQFERARSVDPNKSGYMDMFTLLNPGTDSSDWKNWYWARTAYDLATKGWDAMKRAAVSGNYHMPEAVYYGGSELEPSLVMLRDFLSTHIDLAGVTKFGIVDVHTGLGPSGVDTVILMPGTTPGLAEQVYAQEFAAGNAVLVHNPSHTVVKGYEEVGGFVAEGIAAMLPAPASVEVVTLAQEFGTVAPLFVLKAVVQENAVIHKAPAQRLAYAERLRDVFYTHNSASWRESVLARGVTVFEKLHARWSS